MNPAIDELARTAEKARHAAQQQYRSDRVRLGRKNFYLKYGEYSEEQFAMRAALTAASLSQPLYTHPTAEPVTVPEGAQPTKAETVASMLEEFADIDEAEGGNPYVIEGERQAAKLIREVTARAEAAEALISAQEDAVARVGMAPAAHDVLAERQRQVDAEGWAPEHDDTHADRQLSQAAACYAAPELLSPPTLVPHHWTDDRRYMDDVSQPVGQVEVPAGWPWDGQWWKPSDRRHDLVKAAALLLAEIERLDRLALSSPEPRK